MKRVLHHPFLLAVSLVLAGLATALVVFTYKREKQLQHNYFLIAANILTQPQDYYFTSQNNCFATLHIQPSVHDDTLRLDFDSTISLSLGTQKQQMKSKGSLRFNSLNQLIGALGSIHFNTDTFQFSSLGLHPMQLQFSRVAHKQKEQLFSSEVPGPLSLVRFSSDFLQMRHPLLPHRNVAKEGAQLGSILQEFAFSAQQIPCDNAHTTPLNVSSLIKATNSIATHYSATHLFLNKLLNAAPDSYEQ